jgi:hypothetical protein
VTILNNAQNIAMRSAGFGIIDNYFPVKKMLKIHVFKNYLLEVVKVKHACICLYSVPIPSVFPQAYVYALPSSIFINWEIINLSVQLPMVHVDLRLGLFSPI